MGRLVQDKIFTIQLCLIKIFLSFKKESISIANQREREKKNVIKKKNKKEREKGCLCHIVQ